MVPCLKLKKMAWCWVEKVNPEEIRQEHIVLAYCINLPACKRGTCRRNCKGNPNCLVAIGEQIWLGEIDENAFHNIIDPNSERRDKNMFAGLINLGATCYVNTFLQVWFHNLALRRSLYQCYNSGAQEDNIESDYEPQSICEHLQYLFALLQNSNRKYINPSGLVKALGLDTGQQQDAQEFSKLFLSLLEDTVFKQNTHLQNVIQHEFCGQFSYVTVCNQCGRSSAVPSIFHELELNIQGHKNLTDCVTEFLKEEKLDGENCYFCESCQSKQNATRRIRLHSLPPTLNLQLMHFVFDRQTGHKKKLNTFISFPEQLDMGAFLEGKQDQKCVYELTAVLIHQGISAYSGHYIAHVRDTPTGDWYKFNDEEIEKMEGKKLQLGNEEDIAETVKSQTQKPKCGEGYHCSRNAYMLVYKSQEEESSDPSRTNVEVPAFLQRLVDQDNHKFEEWCCEMAHLRKQSVDKGKAKHEEVKELYDLLPAEDGELYEFVPLDWLKKWLGDSMATEKINNSLFLCSHGKLHPDKVAKTKRISFQAAQLLYKRYGGGPRLGGFSLCRECVAQRCRVLHLKNKLNQEYKEVSNLIKCTASGEGYWVGKASLRSWRQLALDLLEDKLETKHGSNRGNSGEGPHSIVCKEFGPELSESNKDDMKTFNEDIVCSHGGLSIFKDEQKLVSPEVWTKLTEYFPKAPEFTQDKEPCQQCMTLEQEKKDNEVVTKMMALDQKNQLHNLFHEENRPTLTIWPQGTDVLYIVPLYFVDTWRQFIRMPKKSPPVFNVGNTLLLCPHGGFMFTYDSLINGDGQYIALLWPSEWEVISRLFIVDQPISIHCFKQTTANGPTAWYPTQPYLCWECREGFLLQQQRDLREYTQATVYIFKVIKDKKRMIDRNSVAEEEKEEPPKVDIEQDPGFSQSENGAKQRKLIDGSAASTPVTHMTHLGGISRNSRYRNLTQEKALIVSANQTLKELKIQIMHAFAVALCNQDLSIYGRRLTDDSATLGSLGVIPESIICLKVEEPKPGNVEMYDIYQETMPEEGFKGTGLLGH